MAEATPGSLVPLGQANTGSAFVLDQNIGGSILKLAREEERYKDARAAREAQRRAQEDARNFAAQQKLLEKPEEFGLHYQKLGQQMLGNYLNEYTNAVKANGGRALNPEQQAVLRAKQLQLYQFAESSKTAETAAATLRTNITQNKYYNKEEVEKDARSMFFGPDGSIKADPTSIDWDKGLKDITAQPKNINIGEVSNDFVKQLAGYYTEKFSTNGVFDMKTVQKHQLPVQLKADGTVDYDNSGRPILKVTPGLMNEINKMPEFATYLDGREKEEKAKSDADPNYIPKERYALAREVLDSEVYAPTIKSRSRIPVRTDQDKDRKKKEQSALERLNLLEAAINDDDPVALQSLNSSTYQGGKIVGVRAVVDEGSSFQAGEFGDLKTMYSRNPRKVKVLTVNRGTKKLPNGTEVDDIIEVKVDPSEAGWQAKLNQALNTANYNVEPEYLKKAIEFKHGKSGSTINQKTGQITTAPAKSTQSKSQPNRSKKNWADDI